jgi:hypothetical protein
MAIDQKQLATEVETQAPSIELISITQSAVSQLQELISQQADASPNLGLRVFV